MDNTDATDPDAWMDHYPVDTDYGPTDNLTLLLEYSQAVMDMRVMQLFGLPSILPPWEITHILRGIDETMRATVIWPANPDPSPAKLHRGWCHVILSDADDAQAAVDLFDGKILGRSTVQASLAVAATVSTAKHPLGYQNPNDEPAQG